MSSREYTPEGYRWDLLPYPFAKIGGKYSCHQIALDRWRRMKLDAHTQFADPLFVDRENHDYRLKPDSPALALGFQQIDTSRIGLKKDFPYNAGGRLSMEHRQD